MGRRGAERAYLYMAERESGLTYQQIADKYGVTRQAVAAVCGKSNPNMFRFITKEGCIYPNLRKWMNDNKVSKKELIRRMGVVPFTTAQRLMGDRLSGRAELTKSEIDSMLMATGMTYEEMFCMEENKC